MPRLQIRTAQFGLVSGVRQERSDQLAIVEPASLFAPEARKGQLFIAIEPVPDGAGGRDACTIAAAAVRKLFYADRSLSVTSALRAALVHANKAVYRHNFDAPPHKRAQVGVTCAVLKGTDLYIAQVPPTQAYVLSAGRLRPLPAINSWTPGTAVAPVIRPGALGTSLFTEPEFYRCTVHPGERFLLCSSNLARLLSREEVERLLRRHEGDDGVAQLALICRQHGIGEAFGLIVEVAPLLSPAARAQPLSPAGVREHGALAMRGLGESFSRLTGELVLLFRRPGRHAATGQRVPVVEQGWDKPAGPSVDPPPIPVPLDLGENLEARHAEMHATARPAPALDLPLSALLGEGNAAVDSIPAAIDLGDVPGALPAPGAPRRAADSPIFQPTIGERFAQPLRRLAGSVGRQARRVRPRRIPPPPMPASRPRGLSYRRIAPPPISFLSLLVLILLVALLVVYGFYLSQRSAQQAITDDLARAEEAVVQLASAPDEAAARALLSDAQQAIALVAASPLMTETNEVAWVRLQELRRQYELAVSTLQRVTYIDDLTLLGVHPAAQGRFDALVVPPPSTTVTVTAELNYLYALDGVAGTIYRIPIEGGDAEPVLSRDTVIASAVTGPMRSIAWREDNLVAIDEGRNDSSYYFRFGGSWGFSRLEGSEAWIRGSARDIEIYETNLYILGAQPGQILRYFSGRYSSFPDPWIQDTSAERDYSRTIDMGIDGRIYLLQPDGTVWVMERGQFVREIRPEGIDPPLVAVQSFFVSPESETGSLYIVDTNGERILVIDKQSGQLVQQVRVRAEGEVQLDALKTVFVDTFGPRPIIYIVNGSQILRATLPAPPPPFRAP